jgi:hypothetical protein
VDGVAPDVYLHALEDSREAIRGLLMRLKVSVSKISYYWLLVS